MHIVYVTSRYPKLSETFVGREMEYLARMGHKVTVCRLKWAGGQEGAIREEVQAIPYQSSPIMLVKGLIWGLRKKPHVVLAILDDVLRLGVGVDQVKALYIASTTLRLAQLLENEKVVHIRAHFLHSPALGAMWLSKLLGIPYSLTAHTLDLRFPRWIIEKAVRQASFCAAISKETVSLLRELRGEDDGIVLVRNGVPLDDFSVQDKSQTIFPPLILAVGRLVEKKGFDVLIRACEHMTRERVPYRCEIVGEGPLHGSLQRLIDKKKLGDRIRLLGAMPFEKVKQKYAEARVVVMASRSSSDGSGRDGLPTVIIEAMALRKPVVATRFAGIPDLVIDEETGLLVEPDRVKELASAIKRVLENDQLATRLAHAGRKRVERNFDMAKQVAKLEANMRRNSRSRR